MAAVLDGFKGSAGLTLCAAGLISTAMLQKFDGACVRRVVDRSGTHVPEHAHDWPVLSIFVIGAYTNRTEIGETFIDGPSAILYRAGTPHRNTVGATGFEQLEIEFDPAWLRCPMPGDAPVVRWTGGRSGAGARHLAHLCVRETNEAAFRAALRNYIETASREARRQPQDWIGKVTRRLKDNDTLKVSDLARDAALHPSWLGAAYKHATGEGLQETAARFRVERAAQLLRETDEPFAGIALDAGFCDQSHMNRTFRRVLGRTPAAVRDDRKSFRQPNA